MGAEGACFYATTSEIIRQTTFKHKMLISNLLGAVRQEMRTKSVKSWLVNV